MQLTAKTAEISLGLFAGDMTRLAETAADAASWGAKLLHFDVMDGVFVPQLTAGAGALQGLSAYACLDAHLMVQRPAELVSDFVKAGTRILTIHAEAEQPERALLLARTAAAANGQQLCAGLALMPSTALEAVQQLFELKPDIVLVLSVDPRNGQPADIDAALDRLNRVRAQLPQALIAFDGGVTPTSLAPIAAALPNIVVSGSAVMRAANPAESFRNMASDLRVAHANTQ